MPAGTGCRLREDEAPYGDDFEVEKSRLSLENTRFWQLSSYPKTTLLGPTRPAGPPVDHCGGPEGTEDSVTLASGHPTFPEYHFPSIGLEGSDRNLQLLKILI
jgi:hypothetical protein